MLMEHTVEPLTAKILPLVFHDQCTMRYSDCENFFHNYRFIIITRQQHIRVSSTLSITIRPENTTGQRTLLLTDC